MSYALLGTNCVPQTVALTSNTKFYAPNNLIYKKTDINQIYKDYINRPRKSSDKSLSDIIESERPELIKRFGKSCCS
jgi:hypothetical protein